MQQTELTFRCFISHKGFQSLFKFCEPYDATPRLAQTDDSNDNKK